MTSRSSSSMTRRRATTISPAGLLSAAATLDGDEAVFNVGTGNATAVGDLLDIINAAAGAAIEPTFAPARAGEWRHGALDSTKSAF